MSSYDTFINNNDKEKLEIAKRRLLAAYIISDDVVEKESLIKKVIKR